ncbi:MAG: sulfurtransferase-like selenium metabolism protein YedF [Bacteroidales bacterium]
MKTADTRGQPCPAPLIATKRALKETLPGESFEILTDSLTSLNNISRFLKDNNTGFNIKESEGFWSLTVSKESNENCTLRAEEYCAETVAHFSKGNFVIVFSSDTMGEGNEELGHLLMSNFIKAVKDLDVLPDKMVFYNKGVTLGSNDSPVAANIREIEKMGVDVLFCSTCVKYYSLEEEISVGSLSNMFEIAQIMASAGNVVKP